LALQVVTMAAAQSQATRGPLASRRITGGPVIALELPTNDATAFSTATSVLNAAGVRSGAEGPALDLSVPLVDFAKPAESAVTLTGLTLGDALDTIARHCPRLRWSEQDGLIVVRMSNRDSFLDRPVRRFALTDAPPRAALEALIRVLAPSRVSADGVAGVAATSATVEAQLPPREGRDVSLALTDVTVLEALNAVARANGALTWSVRYARAPASIATATILLTESRRQAIAGPPEPAAVAGAQRPAVDIRRITIGRDIVAMLLSYARAANVAIGVEHLPGQSLAGPINGLPALNLEGLAPDKAVAIIVGYDSRYQWRKRSGRFLIQPRPDSRSESILETHLPGFTRSKEPLDSVLSGFLERLGATNVRPSSMRLTGQPIPAGTLDAAKQKLIDVSLKKGTSARDVLDEICAAGGSLSWVLRTQGLADTTVASASSFQLQITSAEGWQYDRLFFLPVTAAAPPRRGVLVPPDLDRDIDRTSVAPGSPPAVGFFALAALAKVPIGVESTPDLPDGDPRLSIVAPAPPQIGPGRFSDALYSLLAREPGYELAVSRGVLNIAPAGALSNGTLVLNQPIGAFRVTDMRTADVVALLRARMAGRPEPVMAPAGPSAAAFEQRITIDLANPAPREVLNEILRQNGNVAWIVRYVAKDSGVSGRVVEDDCVIELSALFRGNAPAFTFTHDGLPPRPRPVPGRPPAVPNAAGRVTLSLPVAERSIDYSIARVCRALEITCTVELATPPLARSDPPMRTTATYDFTGMSGAEAVARLTSLLPDLSWKQEGALFRIRSRAIADAGALPLDRKIAAIDRQLATQANIFQTVGQLMDRSQSASLTLPLIGQGLNITTIGPGPARGQPVELHLRDVTVRQILDEIVRQHGAVQWGVRYIEANGLYPEMILTLAGDTGGQGQGIVIR
jgi:hypothetical protein